MGSTAAGCEHRGSLPVDRSLLRDSPDSLLYGGLIGGCQTFSHLQDALLDQTLAQGISQLSLSPPRGAYPSEGAGGYGNGSGSGFLVGGNVVDRQQFLSEQLGHLNAGPSDTRDVESGLLRDYLWNPPLSPASGQPPSYCLNQDAFLRNGWNFPLASGSGRPSNLNRNGFVSSSCLNQDDSLRHGWSSHLASGSGRPSNLNRNGFVSSSCLNQDDSLHQGWNSHLASGSGQPSNLNRNGFVSSSCLNRDAFMGHAGSCSACWNRFTGQQLSRSRNATRAHVRSTNVDQNSRRVYWPPEALNLEDMRGRLVSVAKDQQGCRFLQSVLEKGPRESIDMVFSELKHKVTDLMVDPFANHVLQKLVEVCSDEQRTALVGRLVNSGFQVVNICLNQYGVMTVQKLLERTESYEPLSALIMAISHGTVGLVKDPYGHRVIQHCLKSFSADDTKCILNAVTAHCFEVATDKSGCCVLQQCVECSGGEQSDRLIDEIIALALLLAEDRYGNYVVQHILGLKDQRITASLVRQLKGNFVSLSCNKYGSNVVEKCLLESGEILSSMIIVELVEDPNVSMLLIDNYGNYVIQSALSVSKGAYSTALVNLIKKHYPVMRNNLYGKRILAWFEIRKQQHVQR